MVARKEMSIDERRKYLGRMLERYRRASRAGKTDLLDQMEYVTQMHRKSITRTEQCLYQALAPGGAPSQEEKEAAR